MRTKEEIEEQIEQAIDNNGKFPGMTYEEGVRGALEWATGDIDDKPMDG